MREDLQSLFGPEPEPPRTPSPGSPRSWKKSWPTLFLIPILIAVLHAAAWSLPIALVLGEAFGLSDGRPEPWPGAIALLWLAAFWSAAVIGQSTLGPRQAQLLTIASWAAAVIAWFGLEPIYRESGIWRDLGSLVEGNAYLVPPILISLAIWWQGMHYAFDLPLMSAEELRGVTQRDWIILGGSLVLAIMIGGETGAHALSVATFAVPLTLILSLALVAAAEVEATRKLAVRRGGQAPGWERWARLSSGLGVGVVIVTVIVLALLTPGALNAVLGGLFSIVKLFGIALVYVLYALFYVLYELVRALTSLIQYLFGDVFGPIALPETTFAPPAPVRDQFPERPPQEEWEYAILLRWVVLAIAMVLIAILLFRFRRKRRLLVDTDAMGATRDSVFSAELAKQQLRDLFRRRHRADRAPPLDLNGQPANVREAMRYLQTLAGHQDAGRREAETPDDFVRRLRGTWIGLGAPLNDLAARYERIRYGEQADTAESPDHRPAIEDWNQIWRARKDVELPPKE